MKSIKFFALAFILTTNLIASGMLFFSHSFSGKSSEFLFNGNSGVQMDKKEEIINILMMGIDSLDSKKAKQTRTDTLILFSLNTKTNKASIVSIPRDSKVKLNGSKTFSKINAAYARGGEKLTIQTVRSLMNIPIHHFVKVDYTAVKKTVDDVGGVVVDVKQNMYYVDPVATPPLIINIKKGRQLLNGKKSMEFLRYRKGYIQQDIGRIQAQQQFIEALIKKALEPSQIGNISKYMKTFHQYVVTDMEFSDMLELAKEASEINVSEIQKYTLEGKDVKIGDVSFYELDNELVEKISKEIMKKDEIGED